MENHKIAHSIILFAVIVLSSCTPSEKIIISKSNPTITHLSLNAPEIINFVNSSSYNLTGQCYENGQMINYNFNSGSLTGSVICSSGFWAVSGVDTTSIGDSSSVEITISYTDSKGDTYERSSTVLKDTIIPTEPVLTSVPNNSTVYTETLTMAGSCESGSVVEISGAGIASTYSTDCIAGAFTQIVGFTSGASVKSFSIKAIDNANNESSIFAGNYTLAEPLLTFDNTLDVNTYKTSASESLTVADCSGIAEILITESSTTPLAGDADWAACSSSPGDYTVTIGNTNQGLHLFYVWVKGSDLNIHRSTTRLNFFYDTVPPIISNLTLANGGSIVALPAISYDVIANDSTTPLLEIRLSESSTYVDDNWIPYVATGTVNVSAVSGMKTVYAWVKDSAGNVSVSSAFDSIELEYGDPPSISVNQPDGLTDFIASDPINIEWSCTAGTGVLASPEIPEISYTTDEGESFTIITTNQTNNLSSTTGSYTWTLPAPLANTPFRIKVNCATTAGVISSSYSQVINSPGWKVFIGDPWSALTDISATIANVSSRTRSTVTGDQSYNTYYVKDSAVMKIDSATGLVTRLAGDLFNSGCTMTTGVDPLAGFTFDEPAIIGTDSSKENIYIMSKQCDKIFKIRLSDSEITEWANFTTNNIARYYLTKNQILVFAAGNNIYTADLSSNGNPAVLIHGNGICGPLARTYPANGTNALTISLDTEGQCQDLLIFANDDASKIWLDGQGNGYTYRLDNAGANYIIGETNLGSNRSDNQFCIPSPNENKVYCSNRHSGRVIHRYNLTTDLWESDNEIPFNNNDSGGFLGLGSYPDRLVAIYSLNEIQSIDTNSWVYTVIAGQPLSIFGNGGPPNLVALLNPIDVKYNANTNYLWIRSRAGHARRIDMNVFPYQTDTARAMAGHSEPRFFNLNIAGDRMIHSTSCARTYIQGYDITGLTLTKDTDFLLGPCDNLSGTYPPVTGASATDGSVHIGGGEMRWFSVPVLHSNGNAYFSRNNNNNDTFIYSSNGVTVTREAGRTGAGSYNPADDGMAALGASLTNIRQMVELKTGPNMGDLLVWDNDRLRLITITTESGSPNIYDILDLNLAAGFVNETITDFYYDESTEQIGGLGTGTIYYTTESNNVYKYQTDATMTSATTTSYDFTGTTLEGELRITKIPGKLLIMQQNKNRVLSVPE